MGNKTLSTIPGDILKLMHSMGYMHESEVETATGTTAKSRSRWRSPKGVMFGNEKYFRMEEIKRHLDNRSDQQVGPDSQEGAIL